jgi:hypothetical protein
LKKNPLIRNASGGWPEVSSREKSISAEGQSIILCGLNIFRLPSGKGNLYIKVLSESCGNVLYDCGMISGTSDDISGNCGKISGGCGDVSGIVDEFSGRCGTISDRCGDVLRRCGGISGECGGISDRCGSFVFEEESFLPLRH